MPQHSGKRRTGQHKAHEFSTTGSTYCLTNTPNKMHISPPMTPSKDSSSDSASPPPPYSAGRINEPVMLNVALAPIAVTDGIFLPTSAHRATIESQDFGGTGPATTFNIPAPYIARSPMRPTPASPTHNAMVSLCLGAVAARLAQTKATFRCSASAPVAPTSPAAVASAAALAALGLRTPLRSSLAALAASPAAGPSTTRPLSTPAPPQTQGPDTSAIQASRARASSPPEQEEHTYEDVWVPATAPFVVTPGRSPSNPIYISSQDTTPNRTPALAQQNGGAVNSNQAMIGHTAVAVQATIERATVAVQTDAVYVLSRFATPEPLPFWATNPFHSGTPDTDSSRSTPSSTRRSRRQFKGDDEPEPECPSLQRRIEEILSSMESPPPLPPGRSLARMRIHPKGKRLSYQTERPNEFGPAYLVKVLDSSDEEYKPWPGFPQAPSSNGDANSSGPAIQSSTCHASPSIGPSTPVASGSGQGATPSILGQAASYIDNDNGAESDDYPDLFDFNDAAVNAQVNQLLQDAENDAEVERPKINGKGKAVAR